MAPSLPAYNTRSNSLPSRAHPLTSQIDEHLCRLKSSEEASTSSSSSSISHKLNGLQDMQECVNNLLQLPLIQQALSQQQNMKFLEALLDGSLRLLDICFLSKDLLLQIKGSTNEVQSILRRRGGEFRKCIVSRKTLKEITNRTLENLKGMKTKGSFSPSKDNESMAIVNILKEVEAVTLAVFESFLSLISGRRIQSKIRGWSLISKIIEPKRNMCTEESDSEVNEFQKVNATLQILAAQRTTKFDSLIHVENLQNQLKDVDLCIQDLEDKLECLSRHLLKTRVSLLNILNH